MPISDVLCLYAADGPGSETDGGDAMALILPAWCCWAARGHEEEGPKIKVAKRGCFYFRGILGLLPIFWHLYVQGR